VIFARRSSTTASSLDDATSGMAVIRG
jgi:hypothetical protein